MVRAATGDAEISCERADQLDGDYGPVPIAGLVSHAVAADDAHGFDGSHQMGGLFDQVRIDTATLSRPFGRELLGVFAEFIEAVAPIGNETCIVEPVPHDDMQDSQCQGQVGPRSHRKP